MSDRKSLRLSAILLVAGLLLFVGITALHPGHEDANDHPAVFEEYAASNQWAPVHLGQFASLAVMVAGVLILALGVNPRQGTPSVIGQLTVVSAGVTLTLYGVLQAVDGIALKRAVNAWEHAPELEKAARFASAEAVRWLEEGVRSFHVIMFGLTFILLGSMVIRAARNLRPVGFLMWLSGGLYLAQGWVLGSEGFSATHTLTIVAAEILALLWSVWLLVVAWRTKESAAAATGYGRTLTEGKAGGAGV